MQRISFFIFISFLSILSLFVCSGCGPKTQTTAQKDTSTYSSKSSSTKQGETKSEEEELEELITSTPYMITADYFRKTAGSGHKIQIFGGSSKKEKELEERLAKLEKRLKGLPVRGEDASGTPVLRRKVVLLSLLGDLGLDVLSLLPAALRRTNGLVPVDAAQLSKLLEQKGLDVSDLAKASVRREIALDVGIHAYILVYFPQSQNIGRGQHSSLRIDAVHATQNVLIGSYLVSVDDFSKIAPKISEDIVRATEWSCRIVKVDGQYVYLNAGRLTGLMPGDKLVVYARGKEFIDPITGRSLGFAPGEQRGIIEVETLFGTDAAKAKIIEGQGFKPGDIVKMLEIAISWMKESICINC